MWLDIKGKDFGEKIEKYYRHEEARELIEKAERLRTRPLINWSGQRKVVCITGGSGSGKTTLLEKLEKEKEHYPWGEEINLITHYATRRPRYEGEEGFISLNKPSPNCFIDTEGGEALQIPWSSHHGDNLYFKKDMIAYFNAYDSNTHYFALDGQVIRDKMNLYVVDAQSALQVYDYYEGDSGIQVHTIYIQVDELEREKRLVKRELLNTKVLKGLITEDKANFIANTSILRQQWLDEGDNQSLIDERIIRDRELYNVVKCDYTIDGNKDIEEVYNSLVDCIEHLGGI